MHHSEHSCHIESFSCHIEHFKSFWIVSQKTIFSTSVPIGNIVGNIVGMKCGMKHDDPFQRLLYLKCLVHSTP